MIIPPKPDLCRPQYQIENYLGHGSFGHVWGICDVKQNPPNCNLVVKVLKKGKTTLDRFKQEMEIAKKMGEESIAPKLYSSWECEEQPIELMAKLRGHDLDHLEKPLSGEDVLDLYELVRKMHMKGILHGDLYPRNVFQTPQDHQHFWILDWGLAKTMEQFAKEQKEKKSFLEEQNKETDKFLLSVRPSRIPTAIQGSLSPVMLGRPFPLGKPSTGHALSIERD